MKDKQEKTSNANSSNNHKKTAYTIQQAIQKQHKSTPTEPTVITINNKPQQLPNSLNYVEQTHRSKRKLSETSSTTYSASANNKDEIEVMDDEMIEDNNENNNENNNKDNNEDNNEAPFITVTNKLAPKQRNKEITSHKNTHK